MSAPEGPKRDRENRDKISAPEGPKRDWVPIIVTVVTALVGTTLLTTLLRIKITQMVYSLCRQ